MFNLFLKSISYPKKAQVTIYLFSIMATLVVTAFMVINIGKTAKDKTYTDNSVDAAALGGASVMATGFNYFSDDNNSQKDTQQDYERKKYKDEQNRHDREMLQVDKDAIKYFNDAAAHVPADNNIAAQEDEKARKKAKANYDNSENAQKAENDYQKWADDRQKKRRETLDDDSKTDDYHDVAVSTAYKLLFQNAGVAPRLGKLNSKAYEAFIQSLEPGSVESGEMKTFAWVDGAGRLHTVTGVVEIESAQNQDLKVTPNTLQQQKDLTTQAKDYYQQAQDNAIKAKEQHQQSYDDWIAGACPSLSPLCPKAWVEDGVGDGYDELGVGNIDSAATQRTQWMEGEGGRGKSGSQENGQSLASSSSGDDDEYILEYVNDIQNSRTICASSFQFHMGSVVKSMYGDIDTMTFYPPVQSTAVSNFNYTGEGNIHKQGQDGSDPKHEAGLNASF